MCPRLSLRPRKDKIRLLGFTRYTHARLATLRSSAMLGPSYPNTNARCAVMMISYLPVLIVHYPLGGRRTCRTLACGLEKEGLKEEIAGERGPWRASRAAQPNIFLSSFLIVPPAELWFTYINRVRTLLRAAATVAAVPSVCTQELAGPQIRIARQRPIDPQILHACVRVIAIAPDC